MAYPAIVRLSKVDSNYYRGVKISLLNRSKMIAACREYRKLVQNLVPWDKSCEEEVNAKFGSQSGAGAICQSTGLPVRIILGGLAIGVIGYIMVKKYGV